MSYIVRASWWRPTLKWDIARFSDASRDADILVNCAAECFYEGTVTITKDGEVIREYKVGEKE